ncbi:protein of unknown function DUF1942 [Rhodococcus rhodochrous ATCC 21198]|uniref:DUF4352 domain-containing protein n=1 Tax=Rhodococcus aetherivorans TaxID=191292 RepID=UPI0003E283A6|nr:DUF4352 domain-containing protein [Rhodococcus aetherivorans]ETT24137.1 protein of unknown function DUF1942 [Rhodococcus rhodochrous ATCC 21198]NGP28914.1 DUF4352 domain-containing protein [Rhodococcus aetherivorans]
MSDKPSSPDPERRGNPEYGPPGGSYPPGGGYPPGSYPPGYYQQPPPKKRKLWPWILLGIVVLFFGGCVALIAGSTGDDEVTVTPGNGNSAQADESGLTFQGRQDGDTAANAGDAVTLDEVTITTTPLFEVNEPFNAVLCTTVTINNGGDDPADFADFDWKLQDPAGAIRDTWITGRPNLLGYGDVAPGGTATGEVCFDNRAGSPPGQYVVLYDPSFDFSSDRIGWINQR